MTRDEMIREVEDLKFLIDEKNTRNDGSEEFNNYIDELWDEVDALEAKIKRTVR